MTVFKAYMKITKRNAGLIVLYVAIFMAVTLTFQFTAVRNEEDAQYTAYSLKIGVIDKDKGPLAKGIQEYLSQFHSLIPMEDNKAKLQENLYYGKVAYIIRIPAGFEKAYLEKDAKLPVTKVPGSYTSFYVDQQIDSFFNSVKTYYAAGYSSAEAVQSALSMEQSTVKLLDSGGNEGKMKGYMFFYRYLPYPILCILSFVIGNVLNAFRNGNIRKRMQASAISDRRKNGEILLATALLGVVLWGGYVAVSFLLYKRDFLESPAVGYYLLNSFAMLLTSMSIAYVIGILVDNVNARTGVVNVVSLGMCFLCGVFVPLEFLGKGVTMAAQFLPVYWYEKANDLLIKFGTIRGTAKTQVWQALGIQLVFAAALVCAATALSKSKRQKA